MSKSIMQEKNGECYLCKKLSDGMYRPATERHHVMFGTADRKLSEQYGLTVYLCYDHHRGNQGVHENKDLNIMLRQEAQKAFIKKYPDKDWMKIFGKNYL